MKLGHTDFQPDKRRIQWICLILALGTLVAFGPSLTHGFITFDDPEYVLANMHVQPGLTFDGAVHAFTTGDNSNWHPLTWLSHMVDCQLYGLKSAGHHLTNVLFHMANTVLLFWVLRLMTGAVWRSAFVAALFAWHPLHVESVAWIAERKDVLSAFFWLLTMIAYVRYAQKPDRRRYLWTLALFACGLMAKPMVVTLPFVLLLLDFWPLNRFSNSILQPKQPENDDSNPMGHGQPFRKLVFEKVPFLALSLIASVVTFMVQKKGGAVAGLEGLSTEQRIANAVISYFLYLAKTIWPEHLAVFYPMQHWPAWQVTGAGLVIAGISLAAILLARRHPYVLVGWLWFLGTLVPVIGLVQVGSQSMADRYTYIPLIGVFILLVWGLSELAAKWRIPAKLMAITAALALSACLMLTWFQIQTWKNSIVLFSHDIAVAGGSIIAHNNLGLAFLDAGEYDKALDQFRASLHIQSQRPVTLYDIGMAYEGKQDYQSAIEYFNRALRINPQYAQVHYSMGNVLALQGKYEEAAQEYARALETEPDSIPMNYNMGIMLIKLGHPRESINYLKSALRIRADHPEAHYQLALAYSKLGDLEAALVQYSEAIRFRPGFVLAHLGLGMLLAQQNQLPAAEQHFAKAIELEPKNASAHFNLAAAFEAQGDLDKAATEFSQSIRLKTNNLDALRRFASIMTRQQQFEPAMSAFRDALKVKPDSPEILSNLAWLLATCPKAELRNGLEAVRLAERARDLGDRQDARFLIALDAAYAEAGRFDDAIKTAQQAQELATSAKQTALAEGAAKRLELYRAGKPYHQ